MSTPRAQKVCTQRASASTLPMVGLGPPRLATLRDIVTNRPPTTPLSFPSTCKVEAGLIKTICRASSGNRTHKSARASAPAAVDRYELVKHLYFEMLFTGGDYSLARKILDPHIVHRDMVRDEQYNGIDEVVEYMKGVRACYPRFFVRAAEMAPSDDWTIFVSFEGQAAERTPMFHGVDVFRFTPDGSKIKQVDVYRSNWQGAKGHAQRKAAAEKAARREDMASDPADLGGHWRA